MQSQQTFPPPASPPRYFRHALSLQTVLLAATLTAILFLIPRTMADPDIWWHLRNAQELVTHHTFLTHDLYSFTAPAATWLNHEWLAELPFYLGFRIAGATGILTVTTLVIELIFTGLFLLVRRSCASPAQAAILTILAAVLSTISFGPRTLLFGWLCLVAELLLLERSHRHPRTLYALPVLFTLWINLHGSWLIGLILLILHTVTTSIPLTHGEIHNAARATRHTWSATALTLPALLLNPYTWRLVAYPFNLAYQQKLNIANVQEWQALDWHSPRGRLLFVTLALFAIRQLWRPRQWTPRELAFLTLATYSAMTYSRFLFLFAILAAPILARSFRRPKPSIPTARPGVNACLLLALAALAAQHLHRRMPDEAMQLFPRTLPTIHGPLFNEFLWGGYLIWNQPQTPVFIDSRVDLFEANGTFRDYLDIIHLHDSLALLQKHHIRSVLFEPNTPLVYLLQQTGSWQTVYQDPTAILLQENQPNAAAEPTHSPRHP